MSCRNEGARKNAQEKYQTINEYDYDKNTMFVSAYMYFNRSAEQCVSGVTDILYHSHNSQNAKRVLSVGTHIIACGLSSHPRAATSRFEHFHELFVFSFLSTAVRIVQKIVRFFCLFRPCATQSKTIRYIIIFEMSKPKLFIILSDLMRVDPKIDIHMYGTDK